MDFNTKMGFVVVFLWLLACTLFMIVAVEIINNLKADLEAFKEAASVERDLLLKVCKLELETSLERLNETLKEYEEAIETAVPPERIERYIEILKLDISRRESLMNALKVMERARTRESE